VTITNNSAGEGGGIGSSSFFPARALTVMNSTVSGNHATTGGGITYIGVMNVTGSTVSGNDATNDGGGIYIYDNTFGMSTTLTSSTVTNNRANSGNSGSYAGGGIFISGGVSNVPLLRNSIVADNYNGAGTASEDDIQGDMVDSASSFNLIGTGGAGGLTDGANSNRVGVANPGLGPLASNGGPTQTHAFLPGSPAIDKGSAFGLSTDQRGTTRPIDDPSVPPAPGGDNSDIGAFERQPGNAMSTVTPVGSNVAVQLGPVGVTFSGVSAAGTTSQVSIDPATAGTLPGGYSLGPGLPAYEITTTVQYTPPVTVCLNLPSVNDPATFADLRILHGEGGQLVDRTILAPDSPAPDFNTQTICARVTSLSPFVVAQLLPPADSTAPVVNLTTPADGATYIKGQVFTADYTCQDEAGGSGLASCTGAVANGALIDTSTVGNHTFSVTGTDNAGNSATVTHNYHVVYAFKGFFRPIDNLPLLNIVTPGSAIPVKFSLGGNQGLAIFQAGYPASSPVPCDGNEPGTVIDETATAGSSSLTYDPASDQYSYVWKTETSWKGSCRMLVVRLNDGTEHLAKFSFR
jgi:hypothetical protein